MLLLPGWPDDADGHNEEHACSPASPCLISFPRMICQAGMQEVDQSQLLDQTIVLLIREQATDAHHLPVCPSTEHHLESAHGTAEDLIKLRMDRLILGTLPFPLDKHRPQMPFLRVLAPRSQGKACKDSIVSAGLLCSRTE